VGAGPVVQHGVPVFIYPFSDGDADGDGDGHGHQYAYRVVHANPNGHADVHVGAESDARSDR